MGINCPDKGKAEEILREALLAELNKLSPDQLVMLKITIPTVDNYYLPCVEHPNMIRVVALSGGYPRDEANAMLAKNKGLIGSFSRALTEGLSVDLSDDEYNSLIDKSIQSIYDASIV